PGRGRTRLPGSGRPAAGPRVGTHDPRRVHAVPAGALDVDLPGHSHLPRRRGIQPAGGRHPGRSRPPPSGRLRSVAGARLRSPLPLASRHVPRLWGGETWLADGSSHVSAGPHEGATVAELAQEYGAGLVGNTSYSRYGPRLALLVKFLAAQDDLSVQVHPDDAYALEHEADSGHIGKAEAWYILAAGRDAHVLRGFVRDVSGGEVRRAAEDGSLVDLLQRVPVRPGDVIVNPAGTVHAVRGGITLYEVQQASDLTYRLFDYDRLDSMGGRRELHLDKALDVADLSAAPAVLPEPPVAKPGEWRRLAARPEF